MIVYSVDNFMSDCQSVLNSVNTNAAIVKAIVPFMNILLKDIHTFLKPEHYQSDEHQYKRNLIFNDTETGMSLYTLVWLPGQYTPVHDHGTWGVVGIIDGHLEEQTYIYEKAEQNDPHNLQESNLVLLGPASISTFVPNPDHIHKTGCPDYLSRCVSLHLYGRYMSSFHSYDVQTGTRKRINVGY